MLLIIGSCQTTVHEVHLVMSCHESHYVRILDMYGSQGLRATSRSRDGSKSIDYLLCFPPFLFDKKTLEGQPIITAIVVCCPSVAYR